jgi:hypothetical protein
MRDLARYLRENPQVLVLALISLILGIGAFIAVVIALISSGSGGPTGEPSGAIELLRALHLPLARL